MTENIAKRRTQAERTKTSDKAMFKAAIRLIAKHGATETTLIKVSDESGFSRGLITYRFGSKSGLLIAATEHIMELWQSRVMDRFDSEGHQLLLEVAGAYLNAVRKRSDLMRALFRLMQDSYGSCPELQAHFREYDQRVRTLVANNVRIGQENGDIRKNVDPEQFSLAYIALLRGVAMQYFISPRAVNLDDAINIVEKLCGSLLN